MKLLLSILIFSTLLPADARPAADFSLPAPDGRTIHLADYKGKVVVLEFLQTACPRCIESGGMLQKIYQERSAKGLVVIGISHDAGGLPAIKKYIEEHKLTYPVVLGDLSVAVNYTGASPARPSFDVPLFIFIGRDGIVAEKKTLENLDDRDFYMQMPKSIEAIVDRLLSPESRQKAPAWMSPGKKTAPAKKTASRAGV